MSEKIVRSVKPGESDRSNVNIPKTPVFSTTRWTVILNAGDSKSPQHNDALSQLCQTYWYPVYAFVRRQGSEPEDAQDLTQEFFTLLLEKNYLNRADRERGKFRWFLLGAVRHFLSHQRERDRTLKRGGNQVHIPLDEILAEKRYQLEPSSNLTPEKLFERSWAMTLLVRVREQLREHYASAGKSLLFDHLESFLPGAQRKESYASVARCLGVTEGSLRVELHRMKQTYRRLLRGEVAHTVSAPTEIEEELRHLIEVIQN